jgi:hypothetical protein
MNLQEQIKLQQVIVRFLKALGTIDAEDLRMIIYLADWRHSLTTERTICKGMDWIFEMWGAHSPHIKEAVTESPVFLRNCDGFLPRFNSDRISTTLRNQDLYELEESEKVAIDFVIKTFQKKDICLTKLCYSTHPLQVSNRYDKLNLPKLAREYRRMGGWLPK